MNEINCIPMRKEHINSVYEIGCLSFNSPWSKISIQEETLNPCAFYVVAIKDNEVIGFGGMWLIIDEADITNIAVHPEYRNMGIGTLILKSLIKIASRKDVKAMTLEVRKSNIFAQKLYSNLGFNIEGERIGFYTEPKEDCLIMWKELNK